MKYGDQDVDERGLSEEGRTWWSDHKILFAFFVLGVTILGVLEWTSII